MNSLLIEAAAETSRSFISYLLRSQVINPVSSLENFNCLTHTCFQVQQLNSTKCYKPVIKDVGLC